MYTLTGIYLSLMTTYSLFRKRGGMTYVLQLDKQTPRSLGKRLTSLLHQVQKNIFVVVSEGETVISVAHKH